MTKNKKLAPLTLVTANIQVLKAVRWDGSDEVFDLIYKICPPDHKLAITQNYSIEIVFPTGHTKWLDCGNYFTINNLGNIILLHNSTVQNRYEEIRTENN